MDEIQGVPACRVTEATKPIALREISINKYLMQLRISIFKTQFRLYPSRLFLLPLDAEIHWNLISRDPRGSRASARIPAVFHLAFCSEVSFGNDSQATLKCISVIFRAIEHLLVARNEREKKAGMGTAVASCGKATSLASLSAARDAKWRSH